MRFSLQPRVDIRPFAEICIEAVRRRFDIAGITTVDWGPFAAYVGKCYVTANFAAPLVENAPGLDFPGAVGNGIGNVDTRINHQVLEMGFDAI